MFCEVLQRWQVLKVLGLQAGGVGLSGQGLVALQNELECQEVVGEGLCRAESADHVHSLTVDAEQHASGLHRDDVKVHGEQLRREPVDVSFPKAAIDGLDRDAGDLCQDLQVIGLVCRIEDGGEAALLAVDIRLAGLVSWRSGVAVDGEPALHGCEAPLHVVHVPRGGDLALVQPGDQLVSPALGFLAALNIKILRRLNWQ
mmetsp:Transcript_71682/g.156007  ORF Transcript_71682/g.156007 Transcript_71682/m.156007 type:complete len:201 (-) Transcript_71682:310-912(-)